MTDFVLSNGRCPEYPTSHYGGHFVGTRATFFVKRDFTSFDANASAIPDLAVAEMTTSIIKCGKKFFGGHIKYRANDSQSEIEIGTIRSHDMANGKSRWQFIETSDNVWDFTDLDLWVDTHYRSGKELLFTCFGTPTWASARPTERNAYSDQVGDPDQYNRGIAAEPADMAKWDRFCTTIATRYLGKIKYYEIWNEPNYKNDGTGPTDTTGFFTGTFAKLSEMVRRANQAIKAVDPTAKIVCPPLTSWATTGGGTAEQYFTGMMAAASGDGSTTMKDWVDIIGAHLYVSGNNINDLCDVIDTIKAAMVTAGVSGKEIWDTESAPIGPDVSGMSVELAQRFITRSLMVCAAKGIARTFYFQYDDPTMGIKDTLIISYREIIKELLRSGKIQSACMFADGRVGYYIPDDLLTN
jgi:hypothetical protein